MEYLVVRFVRSRLVKVDGEFMGRTDELLELERGEHKVTLGYVQNFTPENIVVRLRNTTEFTPREVQFEEA
jgi:hypothetical protein